MGLCAQTGDPSLLATILVLLLASIHVGANVQPHQGRKRHYYIAAVDIDWNYQGNETNRFLPTYKKVVFREYEKDFTRAKIHPPWLGLLGPTLRGEEGDTIVVTFRNMATQPCSLHPHGIAYGKQSEGAHYFDNTSQKEKKDDMVKPNSEHVYNWEVTPEVSPKPHDPACLTYSYISHQNVVEDLNAGLVGTLLVCKRGSLDENGKQSGVNQELVFLFGVFDERESIYKPSYIYDDNTSNRHVHYTINGYTKGALPGLSMCAYSTVSLHLLGMSSKPELFSVHMNGQVLQQMGHKVSSLGLISGSSATVSMVPVHTGRWMLSSHVLKHIEMGMHAFVDVKKCDAFKAPKRVLTRQQRLDSREWTYYIAAEEVFWDYAPEMPDHIDESYKSQYLQQSATRIGRKYKKAMYTLYNNESFTERIENKQKKSELGILGPVIRAQIQDVIKVVFKNMASRPYSIYPHGLTIEKSEEGVNYPEGGNHSHAVQPGETHTYVWKVMEEDEPLKGDPRCFTRLYHSAVDTPRDIASGLIGPLLICKSQSLNVRNVQVKADKEQQAMFAVFDENKSWYLDDNIRGFCNPSRVNKADPGFYKSNVMHTINGYVYESGPLLGFCNGDVAKWHISSVGAQDYIQTATAYGHTFELNKRKEDILSLFPMTGETITMNMENIGVWLLATLNSHETTKGMRIKFQDVECFRDHYYEYNYDEPEKQFELLRPPSLDEIKKKEEEKKKQRLKSSNAVETDFDTEMFANELGLRSLKKQNKDSVESMEKLDLSFLDYDAVDVLDGNVRQDTLVTKSTKSTINYSPSLDNKTETNETALYNTTALLDSREVKSNLQTGRLNVTLTGEQKGESVMRGDVFAFSEVRSPFSPDTQSNHSLLNTISQDIRSQLHIQNRTVFGLKDSETVNGDGPQMDSYKVLLPVDFTPENVTVNSTQSNPPGNTTLKTGTSTSFNDTQISGNLSLAGRLQSSSEALLGSESSEEVFIYLKQNHTEVIKTTSVKTKSGNWTYDGTHQNIPTEIPDHMMKYVQKQTTPAPKRTPKMRRVTFRKQPQKGLGIRTKRKKEYKPLVINGLPLSPRGFNPIMTPRGSRPVSPQPVPQEEELMNKPVVIGVPRPDFSDYELYVPGEEPNHLALEELKSDEYDYVNYKDPYSGHLDIQNIDDFKQSGPNVKMYFISAEEVEWDYGGSGQNRRQGTSQLNNRHTKFKKVVFRGYMDGFFRIPEIRGEKEEHLGILGPVIKAEYGQSIMVVFRNNANRPYSLHPNGVSYTKWTEGLSYEDGSTASYKGDNEVLPNTTFTYIWKVPRKAHHTLDEPRCRTWTYYSGVNPEKDIHSGLIGPLLVCPNGTLNNMTDMSEFTLLFMTFDESQSWYYETNNEIIQRKSRRRFQDPNFKEDLKFPSINGITHNLKGLRMYTKQLVRWHLINMGSPTDYQSIHFHGQTFLHQQATSNRHAVFPLLPGGFATLEMYPSKPGLWQLETEIGVNQQRGMQTLFLVLDNDCYRPLGLESGSVKDGQITANITRGYWDPHLARLNNQGKYNAWSTDQNNSFIQVDFQRPVVISQVATQGAKQLFQSQFVTNYSISYSNDHRRWSLYKGDSRYPMKVFAGNQEAYETKTNTFFPPVIARFIRLHPLQWHNTATIRMEYYGCELDGCSVPLGMENGLIEDHRITASSTASNWYLGSWVPSYARLNKQGTVNAWQAKYKDMKQWLQVELPEVKKITGIITQGAKSLGKEMFVTFYSLQYSDDGIHWNDYNEDEDRPQKIFRGNDDNNEHVKNFIYPPIFSRFIRIIPRNWKGSITMRVELLGCDFE